jgi:hypothetical protein
MDHSTAYKLIVEYLSQRFGVPSKRSSLTRRCSTISGWTASTRSTCSRSSIRQYRVKVNEEQARRIRTVEDAVQYVLANLPEARPGS